MIRDLRLRIVTEFDGAAVNKGIATNSKVLKLHKHEFTELGRTQSKVLKDTERGLQTAGRAFTDFGRGAVNAFKSATQGIHSFNTSLGSVFSKIVNLKTAIGGTLVGGLAIAGVKKALDAGQQLSQLQGRVRREFGGAGAGVLALGRGVASGAGLRDEDALRALIPIAEAVQSTQAGTIYRGRRLNASQAAALREQTLGFGGNLLKRITTVTGGDPAEIAEAIAAGGSGPEGIRRFAAAIGANPVFARELNAANQRGQGLKFLQQHGLSEVATSLRKQGITQLGQGTILDLIAKQSGITDEAAAAKRRTFGFQKQAVGAQLENVLGDVGQRALDKLTEKLGKGATLAEKLQGYLSSEKGKQAVDGLANGVSKIADGAIKIAENLPKAFDWLSKHKTAMLATGGAIGGLWGLGKIGGLLGNVAKVPGLGALGGIGVPHVWVDNMPGGGIGGGIGDVAKGAAKGFGALGVAGVVAAGAVGVGAGILADRAFGISDKISRLAIPQSEHNLRAKEAESFRKQIAADNSPTRRNVEGSPGAQKLITALTNNASLNDSGYHITSLGDAATSAAQRNSNITLNLHIDGKQLAARLEPHQAQRQYNRAAGGVAPTSRP